MPPSPLPQIRPASEADAAGIARVQVDTWRAAYRGIISDGYLSALSVENRVPVWTQIIHTATHRVYVSVEEWGVTGFICIGPSPDPDAMPGTGEVGSLYVLPDSWGRGLGLALWQAARAWLMEQQFVAVTLWVLMDNERALRFYHAAGFEAEPATVREITRGEGEPLREIRYRVCLDCPGNNPP